MPPLRRGRGGFFPWLPPHFADRWSTGGQVEGPGKGEAIAFVEDPVALGARLQVGGDLLPFAELQHRRQQRPAEAAALPWRFDPRAQASGTAAAAPPPRPRPCRRGSTPR